MNKYKVFCVTDSKWECVIASEEPTTCPTDSNHAIRSVTLIESDVLVNDGCPTDLSLDDYKSLRINEIDYKTGALISVGFTYDSILFSTSIPAQVNWSSIKDNVADYVFPLAITTKDDNEYMLAEVDVTAFWTAGRDFVKGYLDSGRALKVSINGAVDKSAVDAIIDNR